MGGVHVAVGPLAGYRVLEFAGMGPGPFGGMMLAQLGADVVVVERPGSDPHGLLGNPRLNYLNAGKRSIALNLKDATERALAVRLVDAAHVVIDPFRPGVLERLGLGPEECLARNPGLVYARMTGWGQDGPQAQTAGHDINYIAVTGALHAIGGPDRPEVPLNLLGDFGGGGLYLVLGIVSALLEVERSGRGQTLDVAIVDGVSHLLTGVHSMLANSQWQDRRGVNLLDGGAPFYTTYETSDGRFMAVGAIEPQFFAELVEVLGVDVAVTEQMAQHLWPQQRRVFSAVFRSRTQAEWAIRFAGRDACVTPVLDLTSSPDSSYLASRATVRRTVDGHVRAATAPRFSLYPECGGAQVPPLPGRDQAEVLDDWGLVRH